MQVDRVWNKDQESTRICERIKRNFTNRRRTRYWVSVVYYEPEQGYNIFFNMQPQNTYSRSIPISRLANRAYSELLDIITEVRQTYHFTLNYLNFNEEQVREMRRMFR